MENVLKKLIKFLILLVSRFRKNQNIITEFIVWLNIQQGKNAPLNNKIESSFVLNYLNNSNETLIVDAGAYHGSYTDELLKALPSANYYLFEPAGVQFNHLEDKYKSYKNIHVFNYSLSNKEGLQTLFYNKPGDTQATLNKREESNRNKFFDFSEEVQSIKLSKFWDEHFYGKSIDLLKLDIEGEEYNVLKDLTNHLDKIKLIQFEFGEANLASRVFFKDLWSLFESKNFKIYRYTHYGSLLEINSYSEYDEFFRFTNYLAVNQQIYNSD